MEAQSTLLGAQPVFARFGAMPPVLAGSPIPVLAIHNYSLKPGFSSAHLCWCVGVDRAGDGEHLRHSPTRHRICSARAVTCGVGFAGRRASPDIMIIAAVLFGAASYGSAGHPLLAPGHPGGPGSGALPFGEFMQVFVGYPMRILTAMLVRDGLAAAGIGAIGVDTILVFESGVSQVDLPCSGVKSLWTGALFLIAATWIERRPLGRA
jgi:hypothetical protein